MKGYQRIVRETGRMLVGGEGGKGKGGMGRNLAVEWRKAAIKQREYSFSIILQPLLTTVEQHLTIRKTQFKAVEQY